MSISKIKVKLDNESYPIYVGSNLLENSGNIINSLGKFSSYIVICDRKISKLAKERKIAMNKKYVGNKKKLSHMIDSKENHFNDQADYISTLDEYVLMCNVKLIFFLW